MNQLFYSEIVPPTSHQTLSWWIIFHQDNLLLQQGDSIFQLPQLSSYEAQSLNIQQSLYLGQYANTPCFTATLDTLSEPILPNLLFQPIRQAYETLNQETLFALVSRAKQLLHWDISSQFCGHCGQKTQTSDKERAKVCPQCHTLIYPQISPVMLALIWRHNEILLARSPNFLPGIYSILAGFVEPGETVEQAVTREVYEEVRITIKNMRYVSSQPWPFVSNLMLGFTAEYDQGEILIDPTEIEDAQWFSIDKLPPLPRTMSLSRKMIDAHIKWRRR